MDVLAHVLALTRLENATLCSAGFEAPWGLDFQPAQRATFHLVSRGRAWLTGVEGHDDLHLQQGDLAMVTDGGGHSLRDHPRTPRRRYGERLDPRDLPTDSKRETAVMFCGAVHFEEDGPHPVLSILPPVIHLPADQVRALPDLQSVVQLLMGEARQHRPGARTVIGRLIDVLFIHVVRAWTEAQGDGRAAWLGALRDPSLGKALALLHAHPARPWTVAALAGEVAMSRAPFARRFREEVGETPMAYLRRWRMGLAAHLLRTTSDSVGQIAARAGYDSETSFSRAFRESRDLAPGAYRQRFA